MAILGTFVVTNKKIDDKYYGDKLKTLRAILNNIKPENACPDFVSNSIRHLLDTFKGQVYVFRLQNNDCIVFVNHFSLLNNIEQLVK